MIASATACVDDDGGQRVPGLGLEVTGNGQSAPQGELLRDTIEVQALMTNGWPALGVIQIAFLEGDGMVDLGGIRGRGPGTTLERSTDQDGRIRLTWIMGTAGLDHRVRAYMVGEVDDTVSFDITATSLPPGGAAGLRRPDRWARRNR